MALFWAWIEEKLEILLPRCWRGLDISASSDCGALDFLGWVLVGPHCCWGLVAGCGLKRRDLQRYAEHRNIAIC